MPHALPPFAPQLQAADKPVVSGTVAAKKRRRFPLITVGPLTMKRSLTSTQAQIPVHGNTPPNTYTGNTRKRKNFPRTDSELYGRTRSGQPDVTELAEEEQAR